MAAEPAIPENLVAGGEAGYMALASQLQQHLQPGDWAAAAVTAAAAGPVTLVLPAAAVPTSPAPLPLTATVPMNPTALDVAEAPNSSPHPS